MMGGKLDSGLICRSVRFFLQSMPDYYKLKANFCEVYNEQLNDLLKENSPDSKPISIYSSIGVTGAKVEKVTGLLTIEIESDSHFNRTLEKVNERRKMSATARNSTSSRSHAVIEFEIEGQFVNSDDQKIVSRLMFFDLAGCENTNDHLQHMSSGNTQNEMTNINKSINNFQTVIESLKNGDPAPDFRSSKLTRLLKPCLTTNTKTLMITTISQERKYLSAARSSLAVTQSAGQIKINGVKKNRIKN